MPTFVVKASEVTGILAAQARAYPKAVQKGATISAHRARTHLVKTSPVDLGVYKNSWRIGGLGKGENAGVMVFNDAPHAGIIELGARPHKVNREGIDALTLWVLRHIRIQGPTRQVTHGPRKKGGRATYVDLSRLTEQEARRVAFAIAKKLEKEGQKPTYHLRNSLPLLQRFFVEEVKRQVEKVLASRMGSTP